MNDSVRKNECLSGINACVIIPTYNNEKTLRRVLEGVLAQTNQIIVINDGSTDGTSTILHEYQSLKIINLDSNSGKGCALRAGFQCAKLLGYRYAITIDSDGQHFPTDIPLFVEAIEDCGDNLLIGSRNMAQGGVPRKSSFGNKFSNFWFWFETGIKLQDTQSGFRLYPLELIPKWYATTKFEFEIEVIVRSAWKGILVKNVPINIYYDASERVSHFRPFKDFTRISILNTVLVLITLLYIKPRDFLMSFKKKGIKRFFLENILHNEDSNAKKSFSIALGVFVGISPAWGFQSALVIFLAVLFRLNKAIAFAFSNISSPPAIPVIIFCSLKIGSLFTTQKLRMYWTPTMKFSEIQSGFVYYLLGSIILAVMAAVVFGLVGYFLLSFYSNSRNNK